MEGHASHTFSSIQPRLAIKPCAHRVATCTKTGARASKGSAPHGNAAARKRAAFPRRAGGAAVAFQKSRLSPPHGARRTAGGARGAQRVTRPRRRRARPKKPMRTLALTLARHRTDTHLTTNHRRQTITTMATTMNAIADAIQPSALEALLTQTLADEAGLNDVAEGFKPILAYVASLASNQCVAETFHMFEWEKTCKAYLAPILADEEKCAAVTKKFMDESEKRVPKREVELDIPEGEGEILCNVEFKLAYGGKILLNTTHFHVRRGRIYGLLGHNGCGKSTLMRAISSGALAGFPGAEELMKLRACFVDHDIDGSDANTPTIDFCLQEPVLAPLGREKIREKLLEMEFTEELINKPICNLSGGWKMKLALARAVLLNADLLLLDEPTNHLDVQKQQWLCDFLTGPQCEHVTTLVVSHDSKFLNKVLSDVIHYENMRLKRYTGNLDQFVEQCPMAKAYFSIHDTEMKFTFPVPGPLEASSRAPRPSSRPRTSRSPTRRTATASFIIFEDRLAQR